MLLETLLEDFPKVIPLKHGLECQLRPLQADDESAFHEFFLAVPEQERLFIKHRVIERELIRDWCQNIDLGRNLPLLANSCFLNTTIALGHFWCTVCNNSNQRHLCYSKRYSKIFPRLYH